MYVVNYARNTISRVRLGSAFCASQTHVCVSNFFFFFQAVTFWLFFLWTVLSCTVYGSHKLHFSTTFSLKIGSTVLFTHLKIILLQYFSVFNFNFQFSTVSKRTLNTILYYNSSHDELWLVRICQWVMWEYILTNHYSPYSKL